MDKVCVFKEGTDHIRDARRHGVSKVRAVMGFTPVACAEQLGRISLPHCWQDMPWRTERAPPEEFQHSTPGVTYKPRRGDPSTYDWVWEESSQRWSVMSQSDKMGYASCQMRTSSISGKRSDSHRRSNRKRIGNYARLRFFTGGEEE